MASSNEDHSSSSMSQLTETISFGVDINILENSKFQEFIKKLENSQHVSISMEETYGIITINGKKSAINTSKDQIQKKIQNYHNYGGFSRNNNPIDRELHYTIELSVAKTDFLKNFGQNILNTIEKEAGINSASIVNGKLQLFGNETAVTKVKSDLEKTLYEKNVLITRTMKQHLELNRSGKMWKTFSKKYRVGTSFHDVNRDEKNKGIDTQTRISPHVQRGNHAGHGMRNSISNRPNHNVKFDQDQRRGGYHRVVFSRGQREGRRFHEEQSIQNRIPYSRNLTLNDHHANTSKKNSNDSEEDNRKKRDNATSTEYKDATHQEEYDDDDNNSHIPDCDGSSLSSFSMDNFNDRAQEPVTIALCSDSKVVLSNAIAELQSYSCDLESWVLTQDELRFILEQQQQRDKPTQNNISIKEQSIQIKYYLRQVTQNPSIYIFVYYTRGTWNVKVSGFKSDVHSSVLKIKGYLNDVVPTEVQIPLSNVMGSFLRRKASSDLYRLGNVHNTKIIHYSPPRHVDNTNEHNDDNHCLKLIGPVSHISLAQIKVQTFLENLSEQEQDFPCDTWDISKHISQEIKNHLKKIQESDDYDAVGSVKWYSSALERKQTVPKVTVIVVGLNEEATDDVIQQCKDFVEGYVVWKPSLDEYRALSNILLEQKRPHIFQFQQAWNTYIQLKNESNTIIIPARSKIIADEIKETLQNLAAGRAKQIARISLTIPIQLNTRRFIYQAIQPLLNQAKSKKVFVESKNPRGLTLYGRSEIVTELERDVISIINNIQGKLIIRPLQLSSPESNLMRANLYEHPKRIGRETNTIIRDIQADTTGSSNQAKDKNSSSTLITVMNSRGQTVIVEKGDITKAINVDTIVNAANGPLYHAGGVDKAIADAAGPALDQECKQLIVKNNGLPIPPGKAVKTTAGNLPFKCVIHAIGPQYIDGNQRERPLLFSSILKSLQLAEDESYTSVALPAVSSKTYGFPLADCTNIVVRAIKQFFADSPQSKVKKVILLDVDDTACNSFAREVAIDHSNVVLNDDDELMDYELPPLTAKWCWEDSFDEKTNTDSDIRKIETAFQQYLKTFIAPDLKLDADNLQSGTIVSYSIHFLPDLQQVLASNTNALNSRLVCGYQMRVTTGFKRGIIRYPVAAQQQQQQNRTQLVKYHPKPLDSYDTQIEIIDECWNIIGIMNVAVEQAQQAIRAVIHSATITESFSINLSKDLDNHKKELGKIAIQQQVEINFQEESLGQLSMILKGFRANVSEIKLKFALYAQDILKLQVENDDELRIPKEWGDQNEECKLVEISKTDPCFVRIENRMKETLSNVKIEKIERVQNIQLRHMPNLQIEMELFHGTKTTPPSEVYNGECGLDLTFSISGMWGIGIYFAKNASYSCGSYASQLPNGKRQVFLGQVLTGDVHTCESDPHLRRPPKKNETVSGLRYNSVSGNTGNSDVYIVYENRVAYPTFLITFNS